jgi:FkbM family methyltransferase
MNTKYNNIINELVSIEKKYLKYFFKSDFDFRENITIRTFDLLIKRNKVFNKSINNLKIHFPNSSKIAKEFLLTHEKSPNHIWEPQTHKLLKILCKKKKNIFFGGAFFGDHSCLIANKFPASDIYCFEPVKKQRFYLTKNKKANKLNNLYISKKALFSIHNKKLFIKEEKKDDGDISLSIRKKFNSPFFLTDSLDNFTEKRKIKNIDVLMMDVEGNELNILLGAKNLLKTNSLNSIIFEIHSKYVSWRNGLEKTPIIKLLLNNNFNIYAIRDCHSNKNLRNKIELLDIKNTYLNGPKHGFNMIATKDKNLLINKNILLSKKNYSPKYLFHKSSNKFHYI